MNKGAKIGVSVVAAAVLVGGGYGAYALVGGGGSGKDEAKKPRTVVAEPPSQELAASGAKAFLEAWAKGDLFAAAKLTDDPDKAQAALQSFQDKVKPSAVHLTVGGPTTAPSPAASKSASAPASGAATASAAASAPAAPTGVLESFKASVEFAETGTPWNYDGVLGVVKMSDGTAAVHWAPSVIHPKLDANETITVKPLYAAPSTVTDRKGKPLGGYPSLTGLLNQLRSAAPQGGDPADAGSGVVITSAADAGAGAGASPSPSGSPAAGGGAKTADEKLFTLKEPKAVPNLKLTLDADLQAAAEQAVAGQGGKPASLVAIEPSSGGILAYAFSPSTGQNRAFSGATAPGSTMKVLTSAALLEAGVTPTTPMPCPETTMVTGKSISNDEPGAHPDYTLTDAFVNSCNTSFIEKGKDVLKPNSLPAIAKDVFGLGLVWRTGLSNFDTDIPVEGNMAGAASEFIGQGKVRANPLGMASVAATVQSGVFRQPILVPGMEQKKAARNLSPEVLGSLQSLMVQTVRSGTAAVVKPALPAGSGAKTGTAEVDSSADANSWFTAYSGNLAVAAEVQGGGHGSAAAGPAVSKVLHVGNK
ncbi:MULTISPECIES: penicillin-binding transpeptidase domain-containing protein [Kitasatospora]|uniref:Putative penicillin-binding protein n=1 Tax=Kitasatospora setae (strain ATCC 33774 / DSM 43861 / JCM 3304 / KCC A-0304 / NBRC 14216 / KM-6054) TaxID=452652 RepID=E4NFX0_KITSK|nr:penicillin-binding transpeptidase domain-containing protein [Kitasatospora setae]BAJ30400.1 putative penicillin-binding protein [Kitasatospora setae KM-6054]